MEIKVHDYSLVYKRSSLEVLSIDKGIAKQVNYMGFYFIFLSFSIGISINI